LFNESCPRSVRFCLEASASALTEIEGFVPGRPLSEADRILGRVLGELRYSRLDEVLGGDLHTFLGGLQDRCGRVSRAVQSQYALR
jgi:uncharacterized alpha-E superfamily protein